MMSNELITTTDGRVAEFELAQRRAKVFAQAMAMVPDAFKGNIGDCLIAEEMSQRMGVTTIALMQNMHIIHGKPGLSAKFLIACWNASGKYSPISYEFSGDGDDYGCEAVSAHKQTGQEIRGPKVTMSIVKSEGWLNKKGSKWNGGMRTLMFRYRSVRTGSKHYTPGSK